MALANPGRLTRSSPFRLTVPVEELRALRGPRDIFSDRDEMACGIATALARSAVGPLITRWGGVPCGVGGCLLCGHLDTRTPSTQAPIEPIARKRARHGNR